MFYGFLLRKEDIALVLILRQWAVDEGCAVASVLGSAVFAEPGLPLFRRVDAFAAMCGDPRSHPQHHRRIDAGSTDNNLPFTEIKINNGALTGSASVVSSPQNTWRYKFILATGFRNPNVDDYGKVRAKGEFVTVPNENLEPEYTYNLEIGISKVFPGIAKISKRFRFITI